MKKGVKSKLLTISLQSFFTKFENILWNSLSIEQFFNQMKLYIKLDKPNTFTELDKSLKISIDKIKEENYKNYFIYVYNKDYYKNKQNSKKYTKRRTLKVYKD